MAMPRECKTKLHMAPTPRHETEILDPRAWLRHGIVRQRTERQPKFLCQLHQIELKTLAQHRKRAYSGAKHARACTANPKALGT
eukprot:15482818-Alexandrium_andersonii.AAC.1